MVPDDPPADPSVFTALATARRRLATVVLHERQPLSVSDLVDHLVARRSGRESTADAPQEVTVSLRHVHLPKLASAGVVDRDGSTVALTSTSSATLAVDLALATVDAGRSVDEVFEALGARERLAAVGVLQSTGEQPLSDLADRVAEVVGPTAVADRLAVSLDHVHLPRLDDAGVVTYDRERKRAAFEGLPVPLPQRLERSTDDRRTGGPPAGDGSLSTLL